MISPTHLWSSCTTLIRSQVPDSVWQSTFAQTKPISFKEDVLEIAVPNNLIRDRLEGDLYAPINKALADAHTSPITLHITIDNNNVEEPHTTSVNEIAKTEVINTFKSKRKTSFLHPNFVFDKFVTGPSNRFALAAALSVAEAPGESYNPLFIHGHAGLGKTHLLQAIGHYIKDHYVADPRHPIQRILYVSTETLLNQFVDAIRSNTTIEFKKTYREVDVLLIDDIQFLEGKESLQEEFFHTFNSLHEVNKQIVLTSDRPPDAMSTLEDRMTSRFKMGLLTDIQPPDIETRLAILRKKAELTNCTIDDEVLIFVASNIQDNIRELEGALTRLTAYSSFNKKPLDLDLAKYVLRDITINNQPKIITADTILQATSAMFRIRIDDIIGPHRQRPLVKARQIAMYVFRNLTELSYPDIGRIFGNRDHTTVIHAVQKIEAQMTKEPEIFNQINELIHNIKNTQ
ncbi:MAG: chromosomal replication initiator protein DnaA [Acidimicrobiia bacterium]|nr:chromosomal replication initiator protein DnaA [Acidimicrobiia bacterium]